VNIRVSLVQPGFIHSSSFENTVYTRASRRSFEDPTRSYHAHYVHMADFVARLMGRTRATPETVAEVVLRTIRAADPPLRVPATPDAHLFTLLRRLLPRSTYEERDGAVHGHVDEQEHQGDELDRGREPGAVHRTAQTERRAAPPGGRP
jgi:DNA-directed RNA polymerase specialized sigma24 family protein